MVGFIMSHNNDSDIVLYNNLSRKDLRSLIFHVLYIADTLDYQESVNSVIDNLNHGFDLDIPFDSLVAHSAKAIIDKKDELDQRYKPLLDNWDFKRISVCAKIILRFGIWELLYTDTDPRIIINEAIELCKCFAEKDAHRFVNGILDAIYKERLSSATS